ncbi:MAG: hypothetical protein CMH46_16515 [Muricauda sp.]|nr:MULTISPECIES: hypothetical protein [unclassified Allomuricauda]MAU17132.1 hypothetical protein [Allomuricauda sp.]|tara:strand:+ start:2660 stop:2944 length:285 start_codon:yes stop_codon:yes gene_type:complete
MRKYKIYKDIRKGARIWGLPISLFALLILSILASLLIIIFSFSLMVIVLAMGWNLCWYVGLTKMASNKHLLDFNKVFPDCISNKQDNLLNHVEN